MCYNYHYNLVISPDMIWNTILISVAKHIELSAEEMRGKFVDHPGQKELIVIRDGFSG